MDRFDHSQRSAVPFVRRLIGPCVLFIPAFLVGDRVPKVKISLLFLVVVFYFIFDVSFFMLVAASTSTDRRFGDIG